MNGVTDVLDRDASPQDETVVEVWRLSWFLRVDTNESQVLPERLEQVVQVQLHVATDDNRMRLPCDSVHFLQRNLIDLVVNVKAGHVNSVSRNHIDKVVSRAVFAE